MNKSLEIALQNSFIFNQINKLTINICSNLAQTTIHNCIKLRTAIKHRHFLKYYLKIQIMFKHIVMKEISLFIFNVVNGIYITIHNVELVKIHFLNITNKNV